MSDKMDGYQGRSAMHKTEREFMLTVLPEQGNVLEIGTLDGATCAYWADRRPGANFLSVDPFRKGEGTGAGVAELWDANGNGRQNMNLFHGTLKELDRYVRRELFDFVLVDGDHSHDACLADCRRVAWLLKEDGTLCVHDYGRWELDHLKGVGEAVEEFIAETDFELVEVFRTTAVLRRAEA
ncbi:MAG: class I SAM-dependent methyltransferase [Deltaproteobacteria bacterium]|nr:class I SAM-dependent methyltransferase [Deltaproteobacteria bacterium]